MQKLERSRTILRRVAIVAVAIIAVVFVFSDTLWMIYFSNQQTYVGYIINAFIFTLFFYAMFRVVTVLNAYRHEEQSLSQFQHNQELGPDHFLDGVKTSSIIAVRIQTMHDMRLKRTPVPHQAIASVLVAEESTRTGTLRFLQNILILCGVLGTIVSLSIALLGAGNLLENSSNAGGMGMVIHGMSTALSTTMSAILCYLVLAYFLSAIQNIQTRFLARVEEITSVVLMPLYQVSEDVISQQAIDMVDQAKLLLETIHEKVGLFDFASMQKGFQQERLHAHQLHQQAMAQAQQHHEASLAQAQQEHEVSKRHLSELSAILKDGFRLPRD